MILADVLAQMEYIGIFDVLLPFVLIFTIVFAIMQKVGLFAPGNLSGDAEKKAKESAKKYNVMVALVMGAAVVFPHVMGYYPPDSDIVNIINQALPNVSVVLVAILMALLIIGVMGKRFELGTGSLSGWIAMAAFGIILYIFGNAANWWSRPEWLYFIDNPDTLALIIVILVFAIIIWFITKEDLSDTEKARRAANSWPTQMGGMLK